MITITAIIIGLLCIATFVAITMVTGKFFGKHLDKDYFTAGLSIIILLFFAVLTANVIGSIVMSRI
jgi:hypothetical protein